MPKGGFQPNPDFMKFPGDSPTALTGLAKRCVDRRPTRRPQFSEIVGALLEMMACLAKGWEKLEAPLMAAASPATLDAPAPVTAAAAILSAGETMPNAVKHAPSGDVVITRETLASVRGLKSRQLHPATAVQEEEEMREDEEDVNNGSDSSVAKTSDDSAMVRL